MVENDGFTKKRILLRFGLFIGIFLVLLLILILFSTNTVDAETVVAINDGSNVWINDNSGQKLMLNLKIHNNSAGSGNQLNWINVTFYNVNGFNGATNLSTLTASAASGVVIYNETGTPGFDAGDQEVNGVAPTWGNDSSHWWVNISIDTNHNGIPNSTPTNYNYYVVIQTSANIKTGTQFRVNLTANAINGDWGNTTTIGNTKIIKVDADDPTITYTYPTAGGDTNPYSADPGNVIDIDFGWGGAGSSRLMNASYRVGAGSWVDIFSTPRSVDYTSNWGITWPGSDGIYQISISVWDEAGNFRTHLYFLNTKGFRFIRDTTVPIITYNSPSAGGNTSWYSSNPGNIIDIDFAKGGTSKLVNGTYRVGTNPWRSIFNAGGGGVDSYTINWGVLWSDLGEGNNQVIIRVYNKAGSYTVHNYAFGSTGFIFRKDTIAPTINYNPYPGAGGVTNWYNSNPGNVINIDFIWGSNSPLDNASYRIGSNPWVDIFILDRSSDYTANWNVLWSSLVEGANQISVRVYDTAGNSLTQPYVASTSGFIFQKDVTLPGITYNSPSAGATTNWYSTSPGNFINIDFIWVQDSPLANASYRIGSTGAWVNIFSSDQSSDYTTNWGVSWSSLADGTNSISVRVYDKAGNYVVESYVASTSGFRILKDTLAPGIVYNSPSAGDNTSWYSTDPGDIIDIDFLWVSHSPLLNASYKIGSGSWEEVFSNEQATDYTTDWGINWSALVNGENEIHIRIYDKAGNILLETYSAGTSGFIFRRDTQAPTLNSFTINSGAAYSNSTTVTIIISASDSLSGIYQMRLSNDGVFDTETWEAYSSTKVWVLASGDGIKDIYIQLRDYALVVTSGILGDSITLDTTAPTISEYILTPLNVTEDSSGALNITINITDGTGSGVQNAWINFSINGITSDGFEEMEYIGEQFWRILIDPSEFSETWNGLQNYNIQYQIQVEDNIGNILTTTPLDELIDPVNDPPVISGPPTELLVSANNDYVLDFSSYVSDVDNTLSELSIQTDSSYATVNGLQITFTYPTTITFEEVTITVSDGLASAQCTIDITVTTEPLQKVIKTIQKDEVTARILIVINGNASITTGIQAPGSPPQGLTNLLTFEVTTTTSDWVWLNTMVDYSGFDSSKVDVSTLKLYYWDTSSSSWVICDNNGIDLTNNFVHCNMTKLETFAIFGKEITIKDEDNDGMNDDWELINGLDTNRDDSAEDPDNDKLDNIGEFQHLTDPNNPDSDGDDLPDGWEVNHGLEPLIDTGFDGANGDPDNDNHTNLDEYEHDTDPMDGTSFYKKPTDGGGEGSAFGLYAGIIIVVIIILLLLSYMMISRRRGARGRGREGEPTEGEKFKEIEEEEYELGGEAGPEPEEVEVFEPDEGFEDWGGEEGEVGPLETIKPEVRTFEEAERMEVLELGVVETCAVCQRWIAIGKEAFQCSCGLLSHPNCISSMDQCPQCGRELDLEELGILPEAYELREEVPPELEVPVPAKPMIRKEIKREILTLTSPQAAYFLYLPGKTDESEITKYLDGYLKSRKIGTETANDALKDMEIFISSAAAKKMLDHCYTKGRKKEVMGLIIGEAFEDKENNKTFSIARDVATSDLDASEVDVRFQDFEKLFEHLEGLDYDYQILGWYHSHPDYSSFMSPTDVDTNRRMFKQPFQYAIVIDPIRFDMKAFTHDRIRKKKAKELPFAIFDYERFKQSLSSAGAGAPEVKLKGNKPMIRNELKQELKEIDAPPKRAYLTYLPGVTHDKDIKAFLKEYFNNKKVGRPVLTDGSGTEVTKFIELAAAKKMLDHCFQFRDRMEVMGLIIGKRYQYKDKVLSFGRDVVTSELDATAVNVRFDSFEKLFHDLDNIKYDYQILGWYHSHPGHTCFMSDTDVDTQVRMFKHPYQFAIVVDPVNFDVKSFTLDQRTKTNAKACGFAIIE